ncbi:MAG TPA: hypothetical protein VFB06_04585 [Streptosporangiaceae bacterium]|nr:hypothetical protein [Streptosporangiaceae bacterium]
MSGYTNRCSSSTSPSASSACTSVALPLTYSPPDVSLRRRIFPASYAPVISEFCHTGSVSVDDTTYFVVSLKNGAPGSSSAVRLDHVGANIS